MKTTKEYEVISKKERKNNQEELNYNFVTFDYENHFIITVNNNI